MMERFTDRFAEAERAAQIRDAAELWIFCAVFFLAAIALWYASQTRGGADE
jgi:hypothetical protein